MTGRSTRGGRGRRGSAPDRARARTGSRSGAAARRRQSAPAKPEAARRRLGRMGIPAGLALLTVVALGFGVFPTRTYLDKRAEIARSEQVLAELETANAAAAARAELLERDEEIERMARRDFGLARPGEEVYVVLPPPADPPEVPEGWPFTNLQIRLAMD